MNNDEIKFWIGVAIPTVSFILAQVISYNKQKWDAMKLRNDLNGLGSKLRDVEKAVSGYHLDLAQRVSRLEGAKDAKN